MTVSHSGGPIFELVCSFCGNDLNAEEAASMCALTGRMRCGRPECLEKAKSLAKNLSEEMPSITLRDREKLIFDALARIEEKLDKVLSRDKGCPRCGHDVALMVGDDPAGVARCPNCNHRWYYPKDVAPL